MNQAAWDQLWGTDEIELLHVLDGLSTLQGSEFTVVDSTPGGLLCSASWPPCRDLSFICLHLFGEEQAKGDQ